MNLKKLIGMKWRLVVLFSFTINFISIGQVFEWVAPAGSIDMDVGNDIALDDLGNVYTTGYFQGTVDFDPGVGVVNLTSNGGSDIFIQKLDPSGNLIWVKNIGGTAWDIGESITIDNVGNVYVTGTFSDTTDFNPNSIGVFNLISEGFDDVFILKLTPSGSLIWVKSIGGSSFERATDIIVDGANNVYTTGSFRGTVDFDPDGGVLNLTPGNAWSSIFVQKLDAGGNLIWAKGMYGTGSNATTATAIALDGQGNVYTTGYFENTVNFDPNSGIGTSAVGEFDAFVHKFDAQGNFVWVKIIGGTDHERAYDIVVDDADNIYTTGYFNQTVDFNPNGGVFNLSTIVTIAGSDVFIQKLNAAGDFIWAKKMSGYSNNIGSALALDASGDLYLAGNFGGTVNFNPNGGTAKNLTSAGNFDAFIEKIDSAGNFLWVKGVGGNDYDRSNGVVVDSDSSVYVIGAFKNTVDFDPNGGVMNRTALGNFDSYVLKLGESIHLGLNTPKYSNIKVYPNPSKGSVIIESEDLEGASIRVINLSGQTVYYQPNLNTTSYLFEIEGPIGIYFIEIKGKRGTQQIKWIKCN